MRELSTEKNDIYKKLKEDELVELIKETISVYTKNFDVFKVNEDIKNIYDVKFGEDEIYNDFTVCIKEIRSGGRKKLKDELRIQPKANEVNYIYDMNLDGKIAILLGIYKKDNNLVLCSWKANKSFANGENCISKQVKIDTLEYAMKFGFSQQQYKNGNGFACAFRKEFLFFYIANMSWLHDRPLNYLNIGYKEEIENNDEINENSIELYNRIIFGAPGTGKSYRIKDDINKYGIQKDKYKRVTFHPSYTYSKFVGSYKPFGDENNIGYKFIGGPFLDVLINALKDEKENIVNLLIIEEINRANPASVFGDIFQLLDRDFSGKSIYSVDISNEMRNYVNERLRESGFNEISELYIPRNMYIWATMNSSDQGIYPMDSAFKRRWSFEYIGIDENEDVLEKLGCNIIELPSENIDSYGNRIYKKYKWNDVRKTINEELKMYKIKEDKLLGPFFLSEKELKEDRHNFDNIFKSKVLMYLYEDVLKHKNIKFFKSDNENNINTFSDIMKNYDLGKIFTFELNEYEENEKNIKNLKNELIEV